jgi:large subunit ribosomal protein L15
MQIHEISAPRGARKRKKIVGRGRGSGHGKTSCRGHKGQRAREGRNIKGMLEGGQMPLIRRLPKVGFNSHRPVLYQIVNVESLNRFGKDALVNAESLKEKKLIGSLNKPVKILGNGELKKALVIRIEQISKSAQEKIKKAGGTIEAAAKSGGGSDAQKAKKGESDS